LFKTSFKFGPNYLVVFFSVAAVEGGFIGYGTFDWAPGLGIVDDGTFYGARLHVFDIIPADGFCFGFVPGVAYAGEALTVVSENYFSFSIVECIRLMLFYHWELDFIARL
jgi:hypothetical protein